MKLFNKYILLLLLAGLAFACEEGIDAISAVDPGPDQGSPEIEISYPADGAVVKVLEEVTSVNIEFEASDDIELKEVVVSFDGNQIASFNDFLDYRRFVGEFLYDQVTDGSHTITVSATDTNGKTGSASVTFTKEPAYVPVYPGEVLYMPFDGDFIDLVNIRPATVVGSPGFAGESVVGLDAYKGAADSYLTVPTDVLKLGNEFSAVFWLNVNASPDRAGILVIGPPDEAMPATPNNRTGGFRFFRENAGGEQRFKLNVGNGTADSWFDGGDAADVVPNTDEWHHFAFTIADDYVAVYIDGQIVKDGVFTGVDWTGCDVLSIMSGVPRFTQWNHLSDQSLMDELRIFDRELSQSEIQAIRVAEGGSAYSPKYDGETLYMGFDDGIFREKVSGQMMTVVGTPGFAGEGKVGGNAYAGAADSYLTFPTSGLTTGDEFSAVFWMKINATPDRAGILVMGPEDTVNPDAQNVRTNGFRFFREAAGDDQRFKLNAGNGAADSWFDGGDAADILPDNEWHHFAFTISGSQCTVYIDGEIASQGDFAGIDWTGCDVLSIMSGAPRFTEWNHKSDLSLMDELRMFNKALTQEEVGEIIADEM